MSKLQAASIGSYPRTGEDKDGQRYPRALGHFERKEISAHALRDVEQSVVQEIVREQLDAGVDEVTDGLITWPDPVTRFTRHLSNVETAGLSRYFDNNFYYRLPVITGKPRIGAAVSAPEFKFAQGVSNKPVRAVLTGPLTLARLSTADAKPFDKLQARIDLFRDVLVQEVRGLAAENASIIQIDEPSLLTNPDDLALLKSAYAALAAAKGKSHLVLGLMFGSPLPLLDALKDLPFDGWQLDLTQNLDASLQKLAGAPAAVTLGLGVVDGRGTKLEAVDGLAPRLKTFLSGRTGAHYLTPSCGLEFLPRRGAFEKLRRLADLKRQIETLPVEGARA